MQRQHIGEPEGTALKIEADLPAARQVSGSLQLLLAGFENQLLDIESLVVWRNT